MENTSSWESWFQTVAGGVADKYASATWVQPYELDKLKIMARGETSFYNEGQPTGPQSGTIAGINPGVLLLVGAAVVAVLLLKD